MAEMTMRVNLLQLIFSGASIWRWNDKLRPAQLAEIEKQGHKMLIACALCHENTAHLPRQQASAIASRVIMGGLADYFYRLIITDIKPPVFYKIRQNRMHYQQLTEHVLEKLLPVLSPLPAFWSFMENWHREQPEGLEREILGAAHLFASQWEFRLIQPLNGFDEEMNVIRDSFVNGLAQYENLKGMKDLQNPERGLAKFANLCGQLRFQIRWTQTSRAPATTVLGHMFMVAAISFLYSIELGFGKQRANNNFFTGLFHDFPEVLTRDIISPVKQSYEELPRLIREYEKEEMERRVLSPLRNDMLAALAKRIEWYLGLESETEFAQNCVINGKLESFRELEDLDRFDSDEFDPRDGRLVKICDLLSAFLEAHNSIRNGATSPQLVEGRARLKGKLLDMSPARLGINALMADFD